METLSSLIFPLLGYLSGSLPFSVWVTRLAKGVDVRNAGSGHATTTNTIRQAGFGWGALVAILDVAKGFIPTFLAFRYSGDTWVIVFTAALVVVGHCWPLFGQFRGGMGLAPFAGALFVVNWVAVAIGLGLLLTLLFTLRHGARASVLTGILIAPVFWLFNLRDLEFWIALACGLVIAYRFFMDWNRKYRELWLDREKPGA
ncbi:MAG TPA: glycerol-3-phosphate acyltransferase [Anaerolineales bacterium]|jgi:glycerol-3-phosphate acyltransferase PlsY|nr:glycerol-3-phosphate acyltransferase [Anaerolineales bacterium]